LNNTQIPQVNDVTYLGVHLDRRLSWRRHIERKKVHLKLKASSFYWILNARSPLRLRQTGAAGQHSYFFQILTPVKLTQNLLDWTCLQKQFL